MDMKFPKPQPYLTEEGVVIYNELCQHISDVDALESVDGYELSMLAHFIWLYNYASEKIKDTGGIQITSNGYSQVTAEITIMDKAANRVEKLGAKFGLSLKDRELLNRFKGKKKKRDALDDI